MTRARLLALVTCGLLLMLSACDSADHAAMGHPPGQMPGSGK